MCYNALNVPQYVCYNELHVPQYVCVIMHFMYPGMYVL